MGEKEVNASVVYKELAAGAEIDQQCIANHMVTIYRNAFWTAKQRQGSVIHEISYRACFKPQLPGYFINMLTEKGDVVYDPFSGRGTTAIEAGRLGRHVIANDINPLSAILSKPRFFIPDQAEVTQRLVEIILDKNAKADMDLSMFYHPQTEAEIVSLKNYFIQRKKAGTEDYIDMWIRMIATNRLTGHSPGFFSVYTLPPNQAVSPERQIKINAKLQQTAEYRDTKASILKKSKAIIGKVSLEEKDNLFMSGKSAVFLDNDARYTSEINDNSVQLTVTSPPFLDVVQYSADNWLRCWFNNIDDEKVAQKITMSTTVSAWSEVMSDVFKELFRITKSGGWVAFEVGEVRKASVKLEETIVPLGIEAGFNCEGILINTQQFTKTANIWGVNNNASGTNTNRIILFNKEVQFK